ncbi:hypothetical protein ACLVWU_01890 [Bdellovibrio sp. HCB290]|uniref:hypothetical protein n=1 Tax=Bdellovibrio sp. HCB290 TaxID=3394356 RepID=UPI0039B49EBC
MKKRVMLVMAVIMVLGSVKAMAISEDEMAMETKHLQTEFSDEEIVSPVRVSSEDAMDENAITKTLAAEEDMIRVKSLEQIREKIMRLKEQGSELDEVRVGKEVVSRGHAVFAAEADLAALTKRFNKKSADEVSRILDASLSAK